MLVADGQPTCDPSGLRVRSLPNDTSKEKRTRLCRPSEEDRSVESEIISHSINYIV